MKIKPYIVRENIKNKIDFFQVENTVNYFLSLKNWKRREWGMMQKEHFERLKKILDYAKTTKYIWRML